MEADILKHAWKSNNKLDSPLVHSYEDSNRYFGIIDSLVGVKFSRLKEINLCKYLFI